MRAHRSTGSTGSWGRRSRRPRTWPPRWAPRRPPHRCIPCCTEHARTSNAMSKRVATIGPPHGARGGLGLSLLVERRGEGAVSERAARRAQRQTEQGRHSPAPEPASRSRHRERRASKETERPARLRLGAPPPPCLLCWVRGRSARACVVRQRPRGPAQLSGYVCISPAGCGEIQGSPIRSLILCFRMARWSR